MGHLSFKIKSRNILRIEIFLYIIIIITTIYIFKIYKEFNHNTTINNHFITNVEKDEEKENIISILQKENKDIKAVVNIPNTSINYPILQTNNNHKYLNYNYINQKSKYGSLFFDYRNNLDKENQNIIIYGHNTKDGQMFSDLLKFKDKKFKNNNKIIHLETANKKTNYKIIKTYIITSDSEYYDIINNIYNVTNNKITLITCDYAIKGNKGRFIVVAEEI
ncbi:MAG: sortase domain-containing protein [Oscillospiraceae bacterium]